MNKSKRKNEPAHYMLKIESFSLFSEAQTIKIESDVFEASGHKWRLDLYPNGNQEENGANHISLYVILCDAESYSKGWEFWADVNFFVYDHINHNYATFQDDGNRTRFHEKKLKWGLDKLITLDAFKDSENGYLLNDSCVIGAEVFVVSGYSQKDRCLSITKPPETMNSYTWTIREFSTITENVLYSDVFKVGKVKWKLELYPKGNARGEGTHLSIFLGVHDDGSLSVGWRVYAKFKLRVKNQIYEAGDWFCNSSATWGIQRFIALSELSNSASGFLVNDNLVVAVEISYVGIVKNFI